MLPLVVQANIPAPEPTPNHRGSASPDENTKGAPMPTSRLAALLAIPARRALVVSLLTALLAAAACESDDGPGPSPTPASFVLVTAPPTTAPAMQVVAPAVVVRLRDEAGAPVTEYAASLEVRAGGGTVGAEVATTDASGEITISWTLGRAPVDNVLVVWAGAISIELTVRATLALPYAPKPFGDVHGFLEAEGIEGSTEGLAFSPDGRLVLGVPGGLVNLDPAGAVTRWELTGDAIEAPLGLAFDAAGGLWVADTGALRLVSPGGEVTTPLTTDGAQPLVTPNGMAVGPDGAVYASDCCLGEVIRFDPISGQVTDVLATNLLAEGGPNGLAFDASGEMLYFTTENTALLCQTEGVELTTPLSGLYRVPVAGGVFGAVEALAEDRGLFGDGLAFDAEGNLYVIFDTEADFTIAESAIWVLPAGGGELVRFASVSDRVLANVAFASPPFGEGQLYISLITVPPITPPEARGAEWIEVGIAGLPL